MNKVPTCHTLPGQTTEGAQELLREGVRCIASLELLGKRGELMIEHHGRFYRLRVTQNDKLILTA
jgi:hemin uptake protein HemP